MGRYVDLDKVTVWRCPRNIAQMREWAFGLPVEDVKPVVHAHWIFDGLDSLECSKCHWGWSELYANGDWQSYMTYCPNCGAKMDEVVQK